jgi:hypothetical protein
VTLDAATAIDVAARRARALDVARRVVVAVDVDRPGAALDVALGGAGRARVIARVVGTHAVVALTGDRIVGVAGTGGEQNGEAKGESRHRLLW